MAGNDVSDDYEFSSLDESFLLRIDQSKPKLRTEKETKESNILVFSSTFDENADKKVVQNVKSEPVADSKVISLTSEVKSASTSKCSQDNQPISAAEVNRKRKLKLENENNNPVNSHKMETNHTESSDFDWGSLTDDQFLLMVNELSQRYQKEKNPNPVKQEQIFEPDDFTDHGDADKIPIKSSPVKSEYVADNFGELHEGEDEENGTELAFGDFERYFANKKVNQQRLDADYVKFVKNNSKNSNPDEFLPIFENCTIYVNGKTNPDIATLHKLIILHGGIFVNFLANKKSVTHIVAENLTPRKRIEFRNYKVVKPEWIIDSLKAKKRLPWVDYMLIYNDYGQGKLTFGSKPAYQIEKQSEERIPFTKEKVIPEEIEDVYPMKNELEDDNDQEFENSQHEELEFDQDEETKDNEDDMKADLDNKEERSIDAKHPDFLKFFFAKSRLHHLSSWKAELRQDFLKRALDKLSNKSKPSQPRASGERIIIHVDFDCFFASVSAMYNNPPYDINKHAIAVAHGGPNSDVSSCNYLARAKGVKNGMWLKRAKAKCPELISLGYNFNKYEEVSSEFYKVLLSLDLDSILPVSIDEALIDVSSSIYSGDHTVEELMRSIKDKVMEMTGCSVSCGCGPNVLLAKLSLRQAKPNGCLSVFGYEKDQLMSFLRDIKFQDLPGIGSVINNKLCEELRMDNITLSTVQKLSKEKLVALLGMKTGATIYDQVRGIDATSIDIVANPDEFTRKSVSVDVNWGIRFDTNQQVEEFLKRLSFEVSSRMSKLGVQGTQMTLKLAKRHPNAPVRPPKFMGMGFCEFVSKSSRLGVPTREPGVLSSEMRSLWRMLAIPVSDLRGVAVTVTRLVDDSKAKTEDNNQMKLQFKKFSKVNTPMLRFSPTRLKKPASENSNSEIKFGKKVNTGPISDNLKYEYVSYKKTAPNIMNMFEQIKKDAKPVEQNSDPINLDSSQIDWNIFKELPQDIQGEIKAELQARNINVQAKESPKESPGKRKVITGTSISKQKRDAHQLVFQNSPTKKRTLVSPLKYNQGLRRSPSVSPTKANRFLNGNINVNTVFIDKEFCNQSSTSPVFQDITDHDVLLKRLDEWVRFTIRLGGPHDLDVKLFETYLDGLITCKEFIKMMNLLKHLNNCVVKYEVTLESDKSSEGLDDWNRVVSGLNERYCNTCVRKLNFSSFLTDF